MSDEIDMDEMFPPASMSQDEWEAHFEGQRPEDPMQFSVLLTQLVDGPPGGHDYNTSGISMSIAAQLAFNYVAREVGASGFQASYAALDFYGKVMHIDGPFGVIKASDDLYPQYDLPAKLNEWREGWKPWLKEQATNLLDQNKSHVHPDVRARWEELAAWEGEDEDE